MVNMTFNLLPQIHESVLYILTMKMLIGSDLIPKADHAIQYLHMPEEVFLTH